MIALPFSDSAVEVHRVAPVVDLAPSKNLLSDSAAEVNEADHREHGPGHHAHEADVVGEVIRGRARSVDVRSPEAQSYPCNEVSQHEKRERTTETDLVRAFLGLQQLRVRGGEELVSLSLGGLAGNRHRARQGQRSGNLNLLPAGDDGDHQRDGDSSQNSHQASVALVRRALLFFAKVSPEPMSGCWLWTAGVNGDGYGMFGTGERTNRPRKDRPSCATRVVCAHRWSWEFHCGAIPKGLTVDHLCRISCCVNPRHLELVTNAENVRRAHAARAFFSLPLTAHDWPRMATGGAA